MPGIAAKLIGALPEGMVRRATALQRSNPLAARVAAVLKRASAGDATIGHGEAAGLRFNTFGVNAGYLTGTREADVEDALASLIEPGAVVYDLGAAIGFFTVLAARKVGPEGRVLAFEPFGANFERLRHNVALNGFLHVECHEVAVADAPGRATLQLGRAATQGRLTALPGTPASVGSGEVEVGVTTLDAVVAGGHPPPDIIKMDIEGAEVEALRGASTVLREHRPALLMEMHGRAAEVAAILEPAGYRCSIIGDARPLAQAPWSCHVVGLPAQ